MSEEIKTTEAAEEEAVNIAFDIEAEFVKKELTRDGRLVVYKKPYTVAAPSLVDALAVASFMIEDDEDADEFVDFISVTRVEEKAE